MPTGEGAAVDETPGARHSSCHRWACLAVRG